MRFNIAFRMFFSESRDHLKYLISALFFMKDKITWCLFIEQMLQQHNRRIHIIKYHHIWILIVEIQTKEIRSKVLFLYQCIKTLAHTLNSVLSVLPAPLFLFYRKCCSPQTHCPESFRSKYNDNICQWP